MKIKNEKILELYVGLSEVSHLPGAKFAYAVTRNLNKIKSEITAIQKADTPSEKFVKFDEARVALAASLAKKDEKGNPLKEIVDGVNRFVIEDMDNFEKAFDKLKVEHAQAIKDREKQISDFKEIMEQEVEVDLYMIPPEYLPDGINSKQLAKIMPIVKE